MHWRYTSFPFLMACGWRGLSYIVYSLPHKVKRFPMLSAIIPVFSSYLTAPMTSTNDSGQNPPAKHGINCYFKTPLKCEYFMKSSVFSRLRRPLNNHTQKPARIEKNLWLFFHAKRRTKKWVNSIFSCNFYMYSRKMSKKCIYHSKNAWKKPKG